MNFYELIIIYLSCGAPFGVYYFLQNRNCPVLLHRWLKTGLVFFLWIPYAANLFVNYYFSNKVSLLNFDSLKESDSKQKELSKLQRVIENEIVSKNAGFSLFEIREIFDRYAGLTQAIAEETDATISHTNNEFFKISEKNSAEIAAICNHRRNSKRLSFHQNLAYNDFLDLFAELGNKNIISDELFLPLMKFLEILHDFEMKKAIENIFAETTQINERDSVTNAEVILWKPEQRSPISSTHLSIPFQTLKATNLSSKD